MSTVSDAEENSRLQVQLALVFSQRPLGTAISSDLHYPFFPTLLLAIICTDKVKSEVVLRTGQQGMPCYSTDLLT